MITTFLHELTSKYGSGDGRIKFYEFINNSEELINNAININLQSISKEITDNLATLWTEYFTKKYVERVKEILEKNGFPNRIVDRIIEHLLNDSNNKKPNEKNVEISKINNAKFQISKINNATIQIFDELNGCFGSVSENIRKEIFGEIGGFNREICMRKPDFLEKITTILEKHYIPENVINDIISYLDNHLDNNNKIDIIKISNEVKEEIEKNKDIVFESINKHFEEKKYNTFIEIEDFTDLLAQEWYEICTNEAKIALKKLNIHDRLIDEIINGLSTEKLYNRFWDVYGVINQVSNEINSYMNEIIGIIETINKEIKRANLPREVTADYIEYIKKELNENNLDSKIFDEVVKNFPIQQSHTTELEDLNSDDDIIYGSGETLLLDNENSNSNKRKGKGKTLSIDDVADEMIRKINSMIRNISKGIIENLGKGQWTKELEEKSIEEIQHILKEYDIPNELANNIINNISEEILNNKFLRIENLNNEISDCVENKFQDIQFRKLNKELMQYLDNFEINENTVRYLKLNIRKLLNIILNKTDITDENVVKVTKELIVSIILLKGYEDKEKRLSAWENTKNEISSIFIEGKGIEKKEDPFVKGFHYDINTFEGKNEAIKYEEIDHLSFYSMIDYEIKNGTIAVENQIKNDIISYIKENSTGKDIDTLIKGIGEICKKKGIIRELLTKYKIFRYKTEYKKCSDNLHAETKNHLERYIDDSINNVNKLRIEKVSGLEIKVNPGGNLTLTDNSINYIEKNQNGELVSNTRDRGDGNTKLSIVTTSGGQITNIEDPNRTLLRIIIYSALEKAFKDKIEIEEMRKDESIDFLKSVEELIDSGDIDSNQIPLMSNIKNYIEGNFRKGVNLERTKTIIESINKIIKEQSNNSEYYTNLVKNMHGLSWHKINLKKCIDDLQEKLKKLIEQDINRLKNEISGNDEPKILKSLLIYASIIQGLESRMKIIIIGTSDKDDEFNVEVNPHEEVRQGLIRNFLQDPEPTKKEPKE